MAFSLILPSFIINSPQRPRGTINVIYPPAFRYNLGQTNPKLIHKLILPGDTTLYYQDASNEPRKLKQLHADFLKVPNHDLFLTWLMYEKKMQLLGSSDPGLQVADEYVLPM